MVSFTLRNIPDRLHQKIKKQAKLNRRSLNNEFLACLESNIVSRSKEEVNQILVRAEKLRKKVSGYLTEEKLNKYKILGRE